LSLNAFFQIVVILSGKEIDFISHHLPVGQLSLLKASSFIFVTQKLKFTSSIGLHLNAVVTVDTHHGIINVHEILFA
jgi:hypothetical protein